MNVETQNKTKANERRCVFFVNPLTASTDTETTVDFFGPTLDRKKRKVDKVEEVLDDAIGLFCR